MADYSKLSGRDLIHMLRNWLLQYSGPTEDVFGPALAEVRRRLEPPEPPSEPQRILAALQTMTEEQRRLVLCWFCSGCQRYVGPGDACHCENDE
jgi:hypothetical protein